MTDKATENLIGPKKLFEVLRKKELVKADEQLLLFKIAAGYIEGNKELELYKILTREDRIENIKAGMEVQPLTNRKNEGNTYLDLAMGSIKIRGTTESGIELDNRKEQSFVFCEAKWESDLSLGVSNCSFRNQLQRVIENALLFAGNNYKGKIFVTLITPKLYKEHYEMGINTRFYSYKYEEYTKNIEGTFMKELKLLEETGKIEFRDKNSMNILKNNLNKLILNWITFEELIEKMPEGILKKEVIEKF